MFDNIETVERVSVTFKADALQVEADWPIRTRRGEIVTHLRAWLLTSDPPRLVLSTTRTNLLSASGKTTLSRVLRSNGYEPATADDLTHHLAEHLLGVYRNDGKTTTPTPARRTTDSHLIYPVWPATGGTLIGAATNSFKSLMATAIAIQGSLGIEVLEGNTRPPKQPAPILYCDWESDEASFAERLYALHKGHGLEQVPSVAYRRLTQPLTDVADSLRDEIHRHGYLAAVIDSLSAAVGGSLVDDELANLFWNALASLEVPALVTAHKSQEAIRRNHQRVFGSVMHENRARMLWDVYREPDSNLVRWEVISDNNTGRKGQKLAWRVNVANQGEHEERRLDSITITAVNPDDVRQQPGDGSKMADLIAYALTEHGPQTYGEIAITIGGKADSVRAQLNRHKHLFHKRDDGRWELES